MDTSKCLHPIITRRGVFPCGTCPVCRMKYRKQMALRIYMEKSIDRPKYSYFLTLTYNDENVPQVRGRFCFRKEDLVTFLDSLRHKLRLAGFSLRYFATCEYGEEGYRSHYHIVALLYGKGTLKRHEFNRDYCQPLWRFGYTYDGTLTPYSILYCTAYALKDDEFLERDWRDFPEGKPFRLFSNRPGLGLTDTCVNWWSDYVYNDGDIRSSLSIPLRRGHLSSGVPTGVKRKIREAYPDIYEEIKEANIRYLEESRVKLLENVEKYGSRRNYTDSMFNEVIDSTPDEEIKAFRKALRELGKRQRNPLK